MEALVPVTMHSSGMLLNQAVVREYCTALQVSLSQVFAGMRQAQDQQLITVLDWGVANAKLEEVNSILQQHDYKIHTMRKIKLLSVQAFMELKFKFIPSSTLHIGQLSAHIPIT